jgi:DNA-binding MarR family transcriptional regulator
VQIRLVHDQLTRIFNLLRTETRKSGNRHGLLPVQVEILQYLCACNRYSNTPLAVAEYLGTTKGTVSQTLKALERKGLVTKETDPKDRRVVRLEVTRKGRQVVDRIVPGEAFGAALARLPNEEGAQLPALLDQLLGAMEETTHRSHFAPCRGCNHLELSTRTARCLRRGVTIPRKELELLCRDYEDASASAH